MKNQFFDRDLSWLSFNDRILDEASCENVPLMERIRFLSIYSSNLDEFYRVRIPVHNALKILGKKKKTKQLIDENLDGNLLKIENAVDLQQKKFGEIFTGQVLPQLEMHKIILIYHSDIPEDLKSELKDYFFSHVLGYLHPVYLDGQGEAFFPENNRLYFLVVTEKANCKEQVIFLNIPTDHLPRFIRLKRDDVDYIIFLDDVVRSNMAYLFPSDSIKGCFSFKVTRDAELDLREDYGSDIAELIEKRLSKRDRGLATRLLFEPGLPERFLQLAAEKLHLCTDGIVTGGRYHHLKDLFTLPVSNPLLNYKAWPAIRLKALFRPKDLWSILSDQDLLICTPYHSYDPVLRFFNEAATHPEVSEIYTTIYRVASDSRIAAALVTAALNGKRVQVMVELKARFDEANNIKWAKTMKAAGVHILYSSKKIKVHAKVALVKMRKNQPKRYFGLLATGNFNEGTAAFYTDFILMTSKETMLLEIEKLFTVMAGKDITDHIKKRHFNELFVAGFNLKIRFIELIDREIKNAAQGLSAGIIIKVNNLEERELISKLYDASRAGVKISLIVRSVCCIVPGVEGMSENITVIRIIDRYLEHSRVFIFNNNNRPDVFLGSADWMNRNIHHRIEVCFPVYDDIIRERIIEITELQLADKRQAVAISQHLENIPFDQTGALVRSQQEIYGLISSGNR